MRKNVYIEIEGGCGNQLFQFFAGYALARERDAKLYVISDLVRNNRHGGHSVKDSKYLNELQGIEFIERKQSNKLMRQSTRISGELFRAEGVGLPRNLEDYYKARWIHGYFQSYHFIDKLVRENEIRTDLLLADFARLLPPWVMEPDSGHDLFLFHLRRGDYMHLKDTIGILSEEYFKKIADSIGDITKIRLVSDEPRESLRSISDWLGNLRYIETKEIHPLGLIYLMSRFKGLAISNSTLSWWGGYLNNSGTVFAPRKWFRQMSDPLDLLPMNWNLQDSIWEK